MSVQIAVKLPESLLSQLDALVAEGRFTSRSAAVRAGIEAIAADTRRQVIDDAFRDGFRRVPESSAEVDDARRLAVEAIEDEPWERWW
jgi:Arc/MetJ-type ribon-helix-helix transcriptional regulator